MINIKIEDLNKIKKQVEADGIGLSINENGQVRLCVFIRNRAYWVPIDWQELEEMVVAFNYLCDAYLEGVMGNTEPDTAKD